MGIGKGKVFTPVKRLAGSVSKRVSPMAKRRIGAAAVLGGSAGVGAGAAGMTDVAAARSQGKKRRKKRKG